MGRATSASDDEEKRDDEREGDVTGETGNTNGVPRDRHVEGKGEEVVTLPPC